MPGYPPRRQREKAKQPRATANKYPQETSGRQSQKRRRKEYSRYPMRATCDACAPRLQDHFETKGSQVVEPGSPCAGGCSPGFPSSLLYIACPIFCTSSDNALTAAWIAAWSSPSFTFFRSSIFPSTLVFTSAGTLSPASRIAFSE